MSGAGDSAAAPAPNIVAFIFARGGSKGLPGKNLRLLGGVSLLARAIQTAHGVKEIARVVVSTDDPEIAAAARAEGAEVPFLRPAALASDSAQEWQAWRHAIDFVERQAGARPIDIFVSVPTTCPLRTAKDVARAIALYRKGNLDIVFSVTPADPVPTSVPTEGTGVTRPRMPIRRPGTPTVYDIVPAVFVTHPGYIRQADGIWGGRNASIEIPRERAIEIDTLVDLQRAETLLLQVPQ
jgi:N-acylneuraminate cytidylyltransferase